MCSIVIDNIRVTDPCEEAPAIAVVAENVSQVKKGDERGYSGEC